MAAPTNTSTNSLTNAIGGVLLADKPTKTAAAPEKNQSPSEDKTQPANSSSSTAKNDSTSKQLSASPQPAGEWSLTYNNDRPEELAILVAIDLKSLSTLPMPVTVPPDGNCTIGYHGGIDLNGINSLLAWLSRIKNSITEAEKENTTN